MVLCFWLKYTDGNSLLSKRMEIFLNDVFFCNYMYFIYQCFLEFLISKLAMYLFLQGARKSINTNVKSYCDLNSLLSQRAWYKQKPSKNIIPPSHLIVFLTSCFLSWVSLVFWMPSLPGFLTFFQIFLFNWNEVIK